MSVIVEAGWRSGALNTARHALELSRQVAAFPGSVYSASSTGTHKLVREHEAELVTCSDDVIAPDEVGRLLSASPDARLRMLGDELLAHAHATAGGSAGRGWRG